MTKEQLLLQLKNNNIACTKTQLNLLLALMESTLAENEKFNLTAITDRDAFVEKMLFDSAMALYDIDLADKKVIDIGTGAGFPGMVIRILSPKSEVTLLDSTAKKINYLKEFANKHYLNINGVSNRAEDFARDNREQYDYAFARAVAPLPILLEIITPMVKVDGYFIALKGPGYEQELNESSNALKKLGCVIESLYEFELPESHDKRVIIRIKKKKVTNKKFPRQFNEIKRQPL